MKFKLAILLLFIPFYLSAQEKMYILLLDFNVIDASQDVASDVSNGIRGILSKNSNLTLIEKETLQASFAMKGIKMDECKSIECSLDIAKSLGANKFITGNIAKIGQQIYIETKVINVEDGKIFISENIMTSPDRNIKNIILELGKRLDDKLDSAKKGELSGESTIKNYEEAKRIRTLSYKIGIGLNGGYNRLMVGYSDYKHNYSTGMDFKLGVLIDGEPTGWGIRISGDLFPMDLPDGIYGMNEDIFALQVSLLYNFFSNRVISPFLGFGFGYYFDWIRVDTPASGAISKTYTFLGYSTSLGVELKLLKRFSIIPEIRLHSIQTPDMYWSRNVSYQAGIIAYLN